MEDIQDKTVPRKGVLPCTEYWRAQNFVHGCKLGVCRPGKFHGETAMYGPDECFVYFARCGDAVKVGRTTSLPEKRIKTLQTGCPAPIILMGYVLATPGLEADLHSVLSNENIRGEWFRLTPFVERVIYGQLNEEIV